MGHSRRMHGFTLVELVMTIVLLGIVSAILAPVIVSSVTAYSDTRARNELIARGRLALERLTREIHQAVPNSLRLVTGNTIEFVTAARGGRYVDRDDTAIGSATCATARRFRTGFSLTRLCLLNPDSAPADSDILVIGNTSPALLENGATRVTLTGVEDASPVWTVSFATHTFNSASPGKHYNIVDATHEVGLVGTSLRWLVTNGFDAGVYDDAGDLTGTEPLLVDRVTAVAFTYDSAADGMLNVNLTLSEGNETVQLYEEIYVRNTP